MKQKREKNDRKSVYILKTVKSMQKHIFILFMSYKDLNFIIIEFSLSKIRVVWFKPRN